MKVSHLVKQAQKGNKEALLQLVIADQDAYYRLAYAYMGNEHDAMDAMEDMIVTLYEKIDQLQKGDAFYSWSKTILVNRCKTLLRKRRGFFRWKTNGNYHFPHWLTIIHIAIRNPRWTCRCCYLI